MENPDRDEDFGPDFAMAPMWLLPMLARDGLQPSCEAPVAVSCGMQFRPSSN